MVRLFRTLFAVERKFKKKPPFIDTLRVTVRGGHGGNGLPQYGGIGGQGGCVFFMAKENETLIRLARKYPKQKFSASPGEDSTTNSIVGRRGMDECVKVPTGVQIFDDKGKLLGELNETNSTCIAAGGGMGGCVGNNFIGKPGENRTVTLDLKLIADIGLVGFPNAGKSTLMKSISNAKPKIASYPFTTIRPQIGMLEYKDLRQISLADLPGLIEGAHANFGMGHKFLKHIERTRLLLLIVDIFGFQLSPKHKSRNFIENIFALNKELELYDESLLDKPAVLLINKMDIEGAVELFNKNKDIIDNLDKFVDQCPEEIRPNKLIEFEKIIKISARNRAKVNLVKNELRDVLDKVAAENLEQENKLEMLKEKVMERGPMIF